MSDLFECSYLTDYVLIAKNHNGPRTQPIRKLVPHHMYALWSALQCAKYFKNIPPPRTPSSNYTLGSHGDLVVSVPEEYRAYTTDSGWCDEQAITVEVANISLEKEKGYPVADKAIETLIDLFVDICLRKNINKCTYDGTRNGTLLKHSMFIATPCPGPYLGSKYPLIASEVTRRIQSGEKPKPPKTYRMSSGLIDLRGVNPSGGSTMDPYFAKSTVSALNIRKSANSTSLVIGMLGLNDIVKITSESGGWGYAPDKGGWISLKYTTRVQGITPAPAPVIDTDLTSPWIAKNHLKIGSQGKHVEVVQAMLEFNGADLSAIDGIFGTGTDAAVKAYQKKHGLTPDGIIGQGTWRQIFKEG